MKLGFELRFQQFSAHVNSGETGSPVTHRLPRAMYKRGEWLDLSVRILTSEHRRSSCLDRSCRTFSIEIEAADEVV